MYAMCQSCGSEVVNLDNGKKSTEDGSFLKFDDRSAVLSCKFCGEKQRRDSSEQGGVNPYRTPMISPTTSLSSTDSSISSCSDYSVDINSYDRINQEPIMYRKEDNHYFTTNKRQVSEDPVVSVIDRYKTTSSGRNMKEHNEGETAADIEIKWIGRAQERNGISQPSSDEIESLLWDLPEPDDAEEAVEGSVAYNDDDEEECTDGTNWGKSTSLSSISDEGNASCKFEEKRKIIEERIKGKLKAIVVQLLKSVATESSFEDCDSWVDVVTSLSLEAASFLKPDAVDNKGMGLDGYVKVKCISSGTRNQSQLVRGLVFKKHAAHKHMPTTYEKPRLLLIRDGLGQSSNGLSSFDTMKQQGDAHLKSILEMIDMCQPNVILVEKTVSRDVQESILNKGMTLVLDMKLHRLGRIALCTGSSVVSSETSSIQKLKLCHSFRFEKFVEEYAGVGEGGKRPSKTLMFLEGCPKRLGCTILLKGSHSEELKMIKSVVHCSVLMAYHLILENSFLVDQRSMFSTIACPVVTDTAQDDVQSPSSSALSSPHFKESAAAAATGSPIIDIPISNGFQEEGSPYSSRELWANSPLSYEPYKPVIFSGFSSLSASLKKVIGDSFPLASTYPSLSAYFGLNANEPDGHIVNAASVLANPEGVVTSEIEIKDVNDEPKTDAEGQKQFPVTSPRSPSKLGKEETFDQPIKNEAEVNTVLSQSILVLMSRRNAIKGTICEQSHFSRITFYRDFDIPLGKFLRENILNQRSECSTCGQLPEAHFYYYAHHDKQLTIQVKRLPYGKRLPGEREGKLWMWSRCGKCRPGYETSRLTKRVLISSPASVLSFGKFLELCFSHTLSSTGSSSCGHSFQKDFLHFFGLGPVAAMFRYSPVTTYTVSMPPQKLEFNCSFDAEWLMKEIEDVRTKWMQFFTEVERSLKMIKSRFEASRSTKMELFDIEEMLKQECHDFELNFHNVVKNGYMLLNLNRLRWEILIESHIWDQRLHSLLSLGLSTAPSSADKPVKAHLELKENNASGRGSRGSSSGSNDFAVKEIPVEDHAQEIGDYSAKVIPIEEQDDSSCMSTVTLSDQELLSRQTSLSIGDRRETESSMALQSSLLSNLNSSSLFFWKPFHEIQQIYTNDMKRGYSPRIEPLNSRTTICLPRVHQLLSEEGSRLHILLGNANNSIVSDHEGELSSIIACALALLKDQPSAADIVTDNGHGDVESVHNLIRTPSSSSIHLYSDGSMDSDMSHSTLSDESRLSSFDGFALLETLFPYENFKAEVSMGVTKSLPKGKYSVVCVFANEFRDLRSCCCPSEIDFIASLSRCRNWNAKGGKSKSFFAKTFDDRFIIKEIKKTEFDSFEKIAPHYFKYMKDSFESRNQTCLAKILGIYQVTVRQPKSGKEVRHDLMVMENLMYGRNITRQYDLKGALHARFSSATDIDDVLLDQNFVNDMNSSPLYVSNKAKHILQRAVWNDTSFLNVINVMDYSLLVGVDTQKRELVCGIIDYLRQYTWDKQLETWAKSSLYVPKNVLPTVISPKEYKKRFRKFMSAHFLCVPDDWCSQESSDSCEICSSEDDNKSSKAVKSSLRQVTA